MVLSTYCFAQVSNNLIAPETVVFGVVLDKKTKVDQETGNVFEISRVDIETIYYTKGRLPRIIEVKTLGGFTDSLVQIIPHGVSLDVGQIGFYSLRKDEGSDRFVAAGKEPFTKAGQVLTDGTKRTNNVLIAGVKRALKQEYGYSGLDFATHERIWSAESISNLNESPCSTGNERLSGVEILFDLGNLRLSADREKVLFDVDAVSNRSGIEFISAELILDYSETFAGNGVADEVLKFFKGDMISSNAYSLTAAQDSVQRVKLEIDQSGNSGSRYTFQNSKGHLATGEFVIDDITQIAAIAFADVDLSGKVVYSCDGNLYEFDDVELGDTLNTAQLFNDVSTSLTYSFDNIVPDPVQQTLAFDLLVQSSQPTSFFEGGLVFNYNTLGFGQNIVSSGGLSFTLNSALGATEYVLTVDDFDNERVQFVLSSDSDNPPSPFTIDEEGTVLGRFVMTAIDCEENADITFDAFTQTYGHRFYTGEMPIPFVSYDPVIAEAEIQSKICDCSPPQITGFTPDDITAGTGSVLTITGNNFGSFTANETFVQFSDGDAAGFRFMTCAPTDFITGGVLSWADTEIKVKVPSTDNFPNFTSPAASGKFKVVNGCGEDKSGTRLNVEYAVLNNRVAGRERKIVLSGSGTNPEFCFSFSDEIPQWIRFEFQQALLEWCPSTSVPFRTDQNVTALTAFSPSDNVNLVAFGEVNTPGGIAAVRLGGGYFNNCSPQGEDKVIFINDLDMVIGEGFRNIGNSTNIQRSRMRNHIKHELGHAQMMNHARANGSASVFEQPIMRFSLTDISDGSSSYPIKQRDIDGALELFANSQLIATTAECGSPVVASSNCGIDCVVSSLEINDYLSKESVVYPNPSNGVVTLILPESLDRYDKKSVSLNVFSLDGKKVNSQYILGTNGSIELSVDSPPGMYFVILTLGGDTIMKKITVL